jgi:hypothetical protein
LPFASLATPFLKVALHLVGLDAGGQRERPSERAVGTLAEVVVLLFLLFLFLALALDRERVVVVGPARAAILRRDGP